GSVKKRLRPLRESLYSWGARWHLDREWCLWQALTTLALWHDYPQARQRLFWDNTELPFMIDPDPSGPDIAPPFGGLSGYLPQVESPASYLEYAKQFLRERLSKDPFTSHLKHRLSADVLEANL